MDHSEEHSVHSKFSVKSVEESVRNSCEDEDSGLVVPEDLLESEGKADALVSEESSDHSVVSVKVLHEEADKVPDMEQLVTKGETDLEDGKKYTG
jgi:hypothetical protein